MAGASDGLILQIIDHHQAGDMVGPDTFVVRKEVGSTCSLVWELYRQAEVPLDDQTARILLSGLMSDTSDLTRDNTTNEDKRAWYSLITQLDIGPKEVEDLFRNMAEALSDYSGMDDYEIYMSDYKDYELSGVPVGIGCVEWMDVASMDAFIDRMLAVMPQALADQDRKMVFCMATRYEPNPDPESSEKVIPSGTYIRYDGEDAAQTAEAAYGPGLRPGVCYSQTRLGRKTSSVPTLTEILGS